MNRFKHAATALVALAALTSCGNNGEKANPPASGLQTAISNNTVSVTWADDLTVDYWLFVSSDSRLTTENFSQLSDTPRIIRGARSPSVLCGYPNGKPIYLAMNGRTNGGPGGPGTPTVSATPQPSGGAWTAGTAPVLDFNAVVYASITTCLANSLPTGVFVAVGPNANLATSSDGIAFTTRSAPAGFTTDLYGAASYTASLNTPGSSGLLTIAVGAGGASLISTDGGATFSVGAPFNAAAPALRAVATYYTTFIAVGDGGLTQSSTDGITWTAHPSTTAANLQGIGCSGTQCIAVGDGGNIVVSTDAGATWTQQAITGTPALKRVAYGNFNNNNGAATISLNTWVAVGDAGALFYSTDGGATWNAGAVAGAGNFIGISYTTQFVAIDSAGNSFTSRDGQTWTGPVATGVTAARAIANNTIGFVVVGNGGGTASSF